MDVIIRSFSWFLLSFRMVNVSVYSLHIFNNLGKYLNEFGYRTSSCGKPGYFCF